MDRRFLVGTMSGAFASNVQTIASWPLPARRAYLKERMSSICFCDLQKHSSNGRHMLAWPYLWYHPVFVVYVRIHTVLDLSSFQP